MPHRIRWRGSTRPVPNLQEFRGHGVGDVRVDDRNVGISSGLRIGRFAGILGSVITQIVLTSDPVPLVEATATWMVFLNGGWSFGRRSR